MTRITGSDPLAALLRTRIASLRQSTGRTPGQRAAGGASREQRDFASLATERIRGIDPADPEKQRKALRIFLESVLLMELGTDLVSDPAFAVMVDHVQQQLQADPELARAAAQAAETLLKPTG